MPTEGWVRAGLAVFVSLAVWLPIAAALYGEAKRPRKADRAGSYTLRQPRQVLGIGLVTTAVFYLFFLLAVCLSHDWLGFLFLPFCALGVFLTVYAARWRIIVTGDRLEIFPTFRPPATAYLDDIERVVQEHNGIVAFVGGKRLFAVEFHVAGFAELYSRLRELGKLESTQSRDCFQVRRRRAELVISVPCTLFFGGALAWMIATRPQEPGIASVSLLFAGLILLGVYPFIASLRWKLAVAGDQLTCRTPLGRERTVAFSGVERVNITKSAILLIYGGKPIIRVEPVYRGYDILLERLCAEQVPFYRHGKRVEVDLQEP